MSNYHLDHLQHLETEAIHIMREVAGEFERPALLFSGGKDSICLLRLAEKAFRPSELPTPLLNVDTGHHFPELNEFRDRRAKQLGAKLIVRKVEDAIASGIAIPAPGEISRNRLQIPTLLAAIEEFRFDCCIGGARRDEEKARAKALIPVGISIMRDELPRQKVAGAIALMSATLGIGGALGLPLGGILFDRFGWQSVFWVSAAVGVAIGVAVLAIVGESQVKTRGRFDVPGAILLSGALTSLLLVISKGGTWGWTSEPTILLLLAFAVLVAFWVPYSLKVSQPLVDLRTSARRPILLTNVASILVGFALMANILITTQQLQQPAAANGFGLGAVAAGLVMIPSGLAMVLFAPVAGTMINRVGGRVTLITGSAIMFGGYVGRVFTSGTLPALVIGATVVSIGSALAYAAMPSLIMSNVPITETAAANGLNALLRALGTSTASAVIAATLSLVTVTQGGVQIPAPAAFRQVFWIAAFASLIAAGVAWFVPARARVPGIAARPAAEGPVAVSPAGERGEIVARGQVEFGPGTIFAPPVVTAVKLSGEPVDWSRADSEGVFMLALPGLGRYLLIINADGWAPHSEVVDFEDPALPFRILLAEPLMLTGRVTRDGSAVPVALITLSARTGEFLASTTTDPEGRYELRLPPPGHHILTVLIPETLQTESVKIFATTQSAVNDVQIAAAKRSGTGTADPTETQDQQLR